MGDNKVHQAIGKCIVQVKLKYDKITNMQKVLYLLALAKKIIVCIFSHYSM